MQFTFAQKCIVVLWPSFMAAIVATGLFFSAFDPNELYPFNLDAEVSTLGAYTAGFFVFWVLCATSSMITLYFAVTNSKDIRPSRTPQKHP
ncbi:MAG: hypothetical protein GY779_14740 [Gammaproteobacteria bacterium]|nr:hypothetical protein [Gammaproteobacteria bacterium]